MTVDSASDRDTFLLIVRRYRPDIHVDVPVPGDLVFVSSCLVSLILVSGGKENSDYKMCNHTTRIPLNGSPVNAQNSHQCHICELYGKSFVQKMRTRTTVFPASKIKKTASGTRSEAAKFTLLFSQGSRFISSAIAAAS